MTIQMEHISISDVCVPALRMPSKVTAVNVPILTSKAPIMRARSSISSGAVAMIGLPPRLRVMLADWVATTLLVICSVYERLTTSILESVHT